MIFKEGLGMINVVCTIENKDPEKLTGIESITVSSVSHGYGMVAITVGDSSAEIDGKELIAAVENGMNTH